MNNNSIRINEYLKQQTTTKIISNEQLITIIAFILGFITLRVRTRLFIEIIKTKTEQEAKLEIATYIHTSKH